MNNCVSGQEMELFGSGVARIAEILMNSFCCDEVCRALNLAAGVLQEAFQELATIFLQMDKARAALNRKVFFSSMKIGKAQPAAFIIRRHIPP